MAEDERLWTASARRGAVTHLPGIFGHTVCTRSMRTGVRLTAEEAAEIEARPCAECARVSAAADEFWADLPEEDPTDTRTVEEVLDAAWRATGEYYDPTPVDADATSSAPSPVDGAGVSVQPAVATAAAPTGVGVTDGTDGTATALSEAARAAALEAWRGAWGDDLTPNSLTQRLLDEVAAGVLVAVRPLIERQLRIRLSDELYAWADESEPLVEGARPTPRRRTIRAAAQRVAPEPTDDEMRAALGQLLGGMGQQARNADAGVPMSEIEIPEAIRDLVPLRSGAMPGIQEHVTRSAHERDVAGLVEAYERGRRVANRNMNCPVCSGRSGAVCECTAYCGDCRCEVADPRIVAAHGAGRDQALVAAYWRLCDHAAELRDTKLYRRAHGTSQDRNADGPTQRDARDRWMGLENRCRGIEDGARDLAELLGIPEHEIERPAGGSDA